MRVIIRDFLKPNNSPQSSQAHLKATIEWLCQAHNATGQKGVALAYSLRKGWLAAYPETSGYIISTFLDYFKRSNCNEYKERAYKLAEWEIEVQLKCGAIQSGSVADPAVPCVFNTGQVILGWVRAYKKSQNANYLNAACRAGNWLIKIQDDDGAWRKDVYGGNPHAYNSRTAWGLGELYLVTQDKRYLKAAQKNIAWVLRQQQPNGWFANNSFEAGEYPLIHNIAYAIRGVLELGVMLEDAQYIAAAQTAADALRLQQTVSFTLGSRYDGQWNSIDKSVCLVGCAQLAIIWLKLYKLTNDKIYLNIAKQTNLFIKTTQDLISGNPGIKGGIKGSQPIYGKYQPFSYPNWAAKFFADALMLEDYCAKTCSA